MNIALRPAVPENSPIAGELLLSSLGEMGTVIFGLGDRSRAVLALGRLFTYPDNRYSYSKTIIAEVEGQSAGMLLSFPGYMLNQLQLPLFRQMPAIYPVKDLLRIAWRGLPSLPGIEAKKDEYYIAHLAVFPQYQKRGIGRNLMDLAEEQCHQAGMEKCSLCVDKGHKIARQLYLNLGFQIVDNHFTYERMLKYV